VAIQVSWYYVRHPVDLGPHADIRVLASNLRYGRADPTSFVGLAKASADVITVAELTPEAVTRFTEAGIEETFPYSVLIPRPGAGGIGLWSRYPLTPLSTPRHRGVAMPAARVRIPGISNDPVLASAHIVSPVSDRVNTVEDWSNGMAGAKAQLDNFAQAAGPGAVIVGGDYNSTPDMRQFRDLLTDGYHDAVGQTGAGFAPTFPSDTWFPPVITIDHILTRNAEASSITTIEMPGSDHRSVLATIRVPLEPVATS
jgi:endonuclease/exonuclease/phosphatase (EEP) superfamily protein YafD